MGARARVSLKPDRIKEVINHDVITVKEYDDSLTTFIVWIPVDTPEEDSGSHPSSPHALRDLIFTTSMINPKRIITYNLFDQETGTFGSEGQPPTLRGETSILWYVQKQFEELFEDFLRTKPETQLKEFIPLFKGFSSKKTIREKLQKLSEAYNHDSEAKENLQFFPTTPIKEVPAQSLPKLLTLMKADAKPISKRRTPSTLGCVGEASFEKVRVQNEWKRLRYTMVSGVERKCPEGSQHVQFGHYEFYSCCNLDHVEFPYLIELAVFDRNDDGQGLKIRQCVNFMASTENIFSKIFDVNYRLGRVSISEDAPVTVVVHLLCPVLTWLSYGKTGLGNEGLKNLLGKAFDKILPVPKTPRMYYPPTPKKPLTWIPHGGLGDYAYETRLGDFANEILGIEAQRTNPVKYSTRGWSYLLEGLQKIHKGEFDACQKAINNCRKIGLLPIDFVAEDQDITRHFVGIRVASDPSILLKQVAKDVEEMLHNLPAYTTDYWVGEKYYVMMCVEKGDIRNLFKPICDEYRVPLVSSKGWPPILLRGSIATLSKRAEERGLTPVLLLFYDHDPAGLKISTTFRKNLKDCERGTGWNPEKIVIDRFGLNHDDIDSYGLTWIKNLKTGSGRESSDNAYEREFGRKKCETNALFRNDKTLKAGEEICRTAIEKYYGNDAKERFKRKEGESKQKLKDVYNDQVWQNFYERIEELIESHISKSPEKRNQDIKPVPEKEVEVIIDGQHDGVCPGCKRRFDYNSSFDGRLVRCRSCNLPMRLRKVSEV